MLKKIGTKVKVPKGYKFIVKKNPWGNWEVTLYRVTVTKVSRNIGHIELVKARSRVYETHSNLNYKYHGKGLGALMYSKAIEWCLQRGYRCKSSGYSSEDAKRVWEGKTIRKFFTIKNQPTYAGSEAQTWFAYVKKKPVKKTAKRSAR